MKNLYVVAIGGSGERVMRSLILTLASGVKAQVERIIPIFLENDVDAHAFMKCKDLLRFYNGRPQNGGKIGVNTSYEAISKNPKDWPSFCNTVISEPIVLNRAGEAIGTLDGVIGNYDSDKPIYNRIDEEKNLLFSSDDLSMPLTVGFVGNPNIGSVVLNSLSLSDNAFKNITDSLSPNDGLIVVGSLFGGTGAAGIPLVINSVNSLDSAHHPLLGAVSLLPYFTTTEDKITVEKIDVNRWDVNPDSFDTKTRAALMYYDDYMRSMDYMYYVGDGNAKDVFPHCVGGRGQANRAHLVELLAALSIIDFAKQTKPTGICYKRPIWGINTEPPQIPSNFSSIRNKDLARALVKFRMMKQIFTDPELLQFAINQNTPYTKNIGFTDPMRLNVIDPANDEKSVYSWGFNHIMDEWEKWMTELGCESANRKFQIYNSSEPANDANLTHKFYTETNNKELVSGIAKVRMHHPYFNPFADPVPIPMEAKVSEAMLSAYREIHRNGRLADATTYKEAQRLPLMLRIISRAIDIIIDQRCIDSL